MNARADISAPRPWVAKRTDPKRGEESPWEVLDAKGHLVACMLSEEDAKAVEAAGRAFEESQDSAF